MAKIFKTVSVRDDDAMEGTSTTFIPSDMEDLVQKYWGDDEAERVFPIAFWKFKQLLAASYTGEIAFRVTNIENPMEVDARWVVFDDVIENAVKDPAEEGVCYYILDENYFYGPIGLNTNPARSLYGLNKVVKNSGLSHKTIIIGRIGKDDDNNHFVFFHATKFTLSNGGAGNGGGAAGFQIPAP